MAMFHQLSFKFCPNVDAGGSPAWWRTRNCMGHDLSGICAHGYDGRQNQRC